MLNIAQITKKARQLKKTLLVFVLLLCSAFMISSLLAAVFISVQAEHECSSEVCFICVKIHNAGSFLAQISKISALTLLAGVSLMAAIIPIKLNLFGNISITLVDIKARMNN